MTQSDTTVNAGLQASDLSLPVGRPNFRTLAEHLPGVVYLARNDDCYTALYLNDKWQELTGYPNADMLTGRLNFLELVHPDDLSRIRPTVDAALAARQRFCLVYRLRHSDGRWLWVQEHGVGVFDGDELKYIEGYLTDITQQMRDEEELTRLRRQLKQTVEKFTGDLTASNEELQQEIAERRRVVDLLQQRQRLLQTMLDHADVVAYAKQLDGRYIVVNKRFEEVVDYKNEQIIGKTDEQLFRPEFAAAFRANDLDVIQRNERVKFDEVAPLQDGDHTFVSVKFPLHDTNGRPSAVCGISTDITERIQAEQAVRESERRFRDLYNNTPILMHSIDNHGIIVNVNDHWLKTLGYQREEVIGRKSIDFLTEESKHFAQTTVLPDFFRTGQSIDDPYQMKTNQGKIIDVLLSATSERDADGQFLRSRAMIVDVTRAKQAEIERDRFFNTSLDMLCVASTDGYFKRLNPRWQETLGYSDQELLSRPFIEFIHPDDRQATIEATAKLAQGLDTVYLENRYQCKDGSWRWLAWTCPAPSPGSDRLFAIARDVTEHKRWARELENLTLAVENAMSGVARADADGRFVDVHSGYAALFGYTPQELIGQPWTLTVLTVDQPAIAAVLAQMRDVGRAEVEFQAVRKDASTFYKHLLLVQSTDERGDADGHYIFVRDVTKRKQAEIALRQSEEQQRRLAQRLKVLLRELDHRVKNNLANLLSLISMYERSSPSVGQLAAKMRDKLLTMKAIHEMLAENQWHAVELHVLIEQLGRQFAQLEHRRRRLDVQGPALTVALRQAGPLAMILQELFTNCQKHGAFSCDQGAVQIQWQIDSFDGPTRKVRVDWLETRPSPAPTRGTGGQGLKLIDGLARSEMRGGFSYEIQETGFRCTLDCQLELPSNGSGGGFSEDASA